DYYCQVWDSSNFHRLF
nr:immunoglobulin light chain junction region [Macaca mulatta]